VNCPTTCPSLPLKKNRCISCAYLCFHAAIKWSEGQEVDEATRLAIWEQKLPDNMYVQLRCYKALRKPNEMRQVVREAVCPAKSWQPMRESMTPEMSLRFEQHRKARRLAIIGIIISSIVLVATLGFGIYHLLNP